MATIEMPKVHPLIAPLVYAVPVQLLAYHVAVVEGHRRRPAAQPGEERHGRMIWVLIVLAALPLVMGAMMILMLRTGAIQRLHDKREARGALAGGSVTPADSRVSHALLPKAPPSTRNPARAEANRLICIKPLGNNFSAFFAA